MASKWGRKYWSDLTERTAATAIEATLGVLVATNNTPLDWSDEKIVWSVIGIPTVIAFLKGLLKNLTSTSDQPTASLVNVTSTSGPGAD